MDLNIYNIHFIVGPFGVPKSVEYLANIQRDVDTSGILLLDYGDFINCSKRFRSPVTSTIEGENETIVVNGPANVMDSFDIYHNSEKLQHIDKKVYPHRMFDEFKEFNRMIEKHDMSKCKKMLNHSDEVMQVLQKTVESAGLKLE